MGTRSITKFIEDNNTIVTIYQQYDGYPYPSGVGFQIQEALGSRRLTNGFQDPDNDVNGVGCAAALYIAYAKRDMQAGNVYIIPEEEGDDLMISYTYTIKGYHDAPHLGLQLMIQDPGNSIIYDGPLSEFDSEKL